MAAPRGIRLDYGEEGLDFRLPAGAAGRAEIIRPRFPPPLASPGESEEAAITRALRAPVAGPPLRERIRPGATVAISVCDPTRAQPRIPMLRALLEELPTPPERVTLLIATGTHRPATPSELEAMLGSELLAACAVENHDCRRDSDLVRVGDTATGVPVLLNRRFLEADARITTGFVEPHFFAGFSGGPKMVAPGLAGLETILALHDGPRIGHPRAVFGITEGNPVHDDVREIARMVPTDCGLDVLLDGEKRITAAFAGDLLAEHAAACRRSREEAMRPVGGPTPAAPGRAFEVVVTTNAGFPLDRNLYQAVKGMSAAARIVRRRRDDPLRRRVPGRDPRRRGLREGAPGGRLGRRSAGRPSTAPPRAAPTTGRSRSTAGSSNGRGSGSVRNSPGTRFARPISCRSAISTPPARRRWTPPVPKRGSRCCRTAGHDPVSGGGVRVRVHSAGPARKGVGRASSQSR